MADRTPTTLLSFGDQDRHEKKGSLDIQIVGSAHHVRGLRHNPFSLRALGMLRQADVIHCHQRYLVMSSTAAGLARATGKRVFVSDLGGGGWDISRYVSTENWFHGHLHISQYSRSISKHSELERAHVIMGGVDTVRFSPDPRVRRTGHVLFVGRILPHKGVNDLVDAMPEGMTLDIVGQRYHPEFMAELERRAAGKRVHFHHDATDEELVQHYRSALCIVLPSVYRTMYGDATQVPELLGQTLLEGMACGTPAICTDVASMPEIVQGGKTGFIVPPNDPAALREKIEWLRNHAEAASQMGDASRERILEQFTWPAVVERCLKIYAAG